MPSRFQLESFDGPPTASAAQSPTGLASSEAADFDLEEERLASFDKGYRSGWDDATEAHKREQDTIDMEFAGALQSMSFTYHEARSALQKDVQEFMNEVMRKLLPGQSGEILAAHIVDVINAEVDGGIDKVIELTVAPDKSALMRKLIAGKVAPNLRVIEETSVGSGQAYLRMGDGEQKIDIERALAEMTVAMNAFFDEAVAPPPPLEDSKIA